MDIVRSSILRGAAVAALLIAIGILVGLQMDDAREGYLNEQLKEANLQTEIFLVTNNYLEESSQNYCNVLRKQIPVIARRNAEIGQNLESFSSQSISEQRDYRYIQRKYYVSQLKLYNMLRNYKQQCRSDITLIFF
ncbi:MAG: hypothetical protein SVS85_03095, partial [Candidatus Nanohaloarchaea archaeon]|nr:hypothetical protein [Candidatus Nanohaloarchaea archaeon]